MVMDTRKLPAGAMFQILYRLLFNDGLHPTRTSAITVEVPALRTISRLLDGRVYCLPWMSLKGCVECNCT